MGHVRDQLASLEEDDEEGSASEEAGEDSAHEEDDDDERDHEDEDPDQDPSDDTELGKAQRELNQNRRSANQLKKKISTLADAKLGYSSLMSECLHHHMGDHEYKLCFFDKAEQGYTSLGTWGGWTGAKSGEFKNGELCWGGPARKITVTFECGDEGQILEIIEPSRCLYAAHIKHPGACDEADELELKKPPLRHPREEL